MAKIKEYLKKRLTVLEDEHKKYENKDLDTADRHNAIRVHAQLLEVKEMLKICYIKKSDALDTGLSTA